MQCQKEHKKDDGDEYPPLENHGIIGNMLTTALVTTEANINFMCYPFFDSPAIFCQILDKNKGGFFRIKAESSDRCKQFYWPDTNILITRFLSHEGVGQVADYLPVVCKDHSTTLDLEADGYGWLVRRVSVIRGTMTFEMDIKLTFDFARKTHKTEKYDGGVSFTTDTCELILDCGKDIPLEIREVDRNKPDAEVRAVFTLNEGEHVSFVLRPAHKMVYCAEKSCGMTSSGVCASNGHGNTNNKKGGDKNDGGGHCKSMKQASELAHRSETYGQAPSPVVHRENKCSDTLSDPKKPEQPISAAEDEESEKLKQQKQEQKPDGGAKKKGIGGGENYTILKEQAPIEDMDAFEEVLFNNTVHFWQRWMEKCTYRGRWREMVGRSALVLKLLTFAPTGAIVASPSCSLPEEIGGERNWDYRYTWIRDAAFTLYGLMRIGFTQEAGAFMTWLEKSILTQDTAATHDSEMPIQIMYTIHGSADLPEEELDHLEGYAKSGPVRMGNAAATQMQLDIFGELMDSVYLYNKYGALISYDFWCHLVRLLNWLGDNWKSKDEGLWEVRSGRQHFTYSKVMCWVAFDRGLRLADRRSFPAPREKWLKIRDEIYEEIMTQGYNKEKDTFVMHYGSETLDASLLIMPLVFFIGPNDPRMLKLIKATCKSPKENGLLSNSLVFRYNTETNSDGLTGSEGTFNICTFWLIEAMTRAGKTDPAMMCKARLIFEEMLTYANHLGLYGEETGSAGQILGNFPQAFTHLSLISAAFNLDRAMGSKSS